MRYTQFRRQGKPVCGKIAELLENYVKRCAETSEKIIMSAMLRRTLAGTALLFRRDPVMRDRGAAFQAAEPRVLPHNRRCPMGMKRLDRLQSPRLPFLAFLLGPYDRLPVRRQDEPRAGIGDFDPVAAGLVDIKKKRLLDGMLVRAGLDIDAVLEEDVGRARETAAPDFSVRASAPAQPSPIRRRDGFKGT